MIVIGLTGGPGTGKSVAAEFLRKRGAVVLSGDEAGRQAVDEIAGTLKKLVSAFGKSILAGDGTLDRKKLANIVFADSEARHRLNGIVHPLLLRLLKSELRNTKRKSRVRFAVIDAALIFEWGIADWCDYILVVTAKRDRRISRLRSKGLSRRLAENMIGSQIPDREKAALADYVIRNNGNRRQLRTQIGKFVKLLAKDSK